VRAGRAVVDTDPAFVVEGVMGARWGEDDLATGICEEEEETATVGAHTRSAVC
jgi:hypothetical protein